MKSYRLTMQQIDAYGRHLLAKERSAGTVAKYLRDAKAFLQWLSGRPLRRSWRRNGRVSFLRRATRR